jgi:hypothetical protein
MQILLDSSTLARNPELLNQALGHLREDASFLRDTYPGFDSWLWSKVLPELRKGERTILLEMRSNEVAGFMILKHSSLEKKLCTLRVRPLFESRGLGVRLFEKAFALLQTDRPLLSVSEKTMPKFETLFRHFGFSREAVYQERYLPKVDEFAFNGLLDIPKSRLTMPADTCDAAPTRYSLKQSISGQSSELCAWRHQHAAPACVVPGSSTGNRFGSWRDDICLT